MLTQHFCSPQSASASFGTEIISLHTGKQLSTSKETVRSTKNTRALGSLFGQRPHLCSTLQCPYRDWPVPWAALTSKLVVTPAIHCALPQFAEYTALTQSSSQKSSCEVALVKRRVVTNTASPNEYIFTL